MENIEQVEEWFDKYEKYDFKPKLKFEDLKIKLHTCKQIGAILFLGNKLKDEHKDETYFLHGEHDLLYVGNFDMFEDFTEEDVKIAVAYGIELADDGFEMYASM